MRVYLRELTDQDTELDFTQAEPWVLQAVERVDETEYATEAERALAALRKKAPPREIHANFTIRKIDDVVVLNGSAETHVNLICSRCAIQFPFETKPSFSSLFCQDPEMAGIAHLGADNKPMGQNKGYARHAHDFKGGSMSAQDLDITYLAEEFIELGDVLTEQLRLLLPFQPLCKQDCKGMCPQCGAELNLGRCACAKIVKNAAFSVLQNLKLEKTESVK